MGNTLGFSRDNRENGSYHIGRGALLWEICSKKGEGGALDMGVLQSLKVLTIRMGGFGVDKGDHHFGKACSQDSLEALCGLCSRSRLHL